MGTYFATSGAIRVDGLEATLWPAYQLARGGIGRTFQQIRLAGTLNVLENVMLPLSVMAPTEEKIEARALGWLERLK